MVTKITNGKELEKILLRYSEWDEEEDQLRIPFVWATQFLYDNRRVLLQRLAYPIGLEPIIDELKSIIDWIENGDPGEQE